MPGEKRKPSSIEARAIVSGRNRETYVDRVLKAAARSPTRGMRRGVPTIVNILDVLPEKLRAEVIEDAEDSLGAVGLSDLQNALEESVNLQFHYAGLLNQYDGGQRTVFRDAEHWLARLRELDEDASKKQHHTHRGSATKRT
jgi:hypothetical protein